MATIKATDLATLLATNIDSTYNVVVFDSSGETYQVEFEAATHQANTNNDCICIKQASLTIPSADVLQLNTTPLTIVPAQGVGTAIEVLSACVSIDYGTTPYATNVGLSLRCDDGGSVEPQVISLTALNASTSSIRKLAVDSTFAAADSQILENIPLEVYVPTGNPTAGDSDITVYVTYRVITL